MRRVACVIVLWALTAPAAADDRPLSEAVSVAREGECLTADGLLPHLRTWLERDAIDARLGVLIEESGPGARFVVLHDGRPSASRTFDRLPASCADRRAVVALAVALAVDAALLESLRADAPPSADAPPPASPPPASPSPAPPPAPPIVRLELAAEGQALFEVLPEVAGAWQVGPRLVIADAFELALSAWVTSVSGAALAEGRVSAQLAGGRLDACVRRPIGAIYLRGCGGAAAGVALGAGEGVPGAREARVPFVGLLARAALGLPLTDWLALELSADGWIALLRPRFDVIDASTGAASQSATLPLGGGLASLGVVLGF
ncbi:MAG: hypothetical protein VYE22_27685 [Myxococcota bacterium]|nr:hypothetical protein [Myxococcota bacterium]